MWPLTSWHTTPRHSLCCISFNELEPSSPVLIRKIFPFWGALQSPHNSYSTDGNFKLQGLFTLGQGLHDIVKEQNAKNHVEMVESQASIDKIHQKKSTFLT